MDKIFIVATMDVEPATSTTHASATGPESWEDGEKFIAVTSIEPVTLAFPSPFSFTLKSRWCRVICSWS